jgi:CHASE2 domain-containing sensor protein
MFARITQREAHRGTAARQAAARLRRLAAALAAVTCTLLASAVVMPAAWAVNVIPPGGGLVQAPAVGAVTAGGMPGWQITLIALGAALVAATAAVLLDRARAARRPAPAITT